VHDAAKEIMLQKEYNKAHDAWAAFFIKGELYTSIYDHPLFICDPWPVDWHSKDLHLSNIILEVHEPFLVVSDSVLEKVSSRACHSYVDILYKGGLHRLRGNAGIYTEASIKLDFKMISSVQTV